MDETRLSELIAQIQRATELGGVVCLHEVCRDCPELMPELQARLRAFQDTKQLAPKLNTDKVSATTDVPDQVTFTLDFVNPNPQSNGPVPGADVPLLLGRYRVVRLLGRGSFGEVFEARDELLLRKVAIKCHRSDVNRPEYWTDNFLAEARKLASIEHPHVVRVHDVAEADGKVLIVSAYIDGSDLSQRLKRGRLSLGHGLPIVVSIADALHHLHLRGLVHRDVKPANILLDQQNRSYLSDFGLAASEADLSRERPGIQGTYAYMSPEQVNGDSHLVDARTDIYGLGVVLYQILTGRIPFMASNLHEYREQILRRAPRPPRTIDDSIPQELERICLKCLAKSYEDRYTTALDLAADLRAWMIRAAEPVNAPIPPLRIRRRWATPWKGVAWTAAGFLCLGLMILFALRIPEKQLAPQLFAAELHKRVPATPQPGEWFDLLTEEPTVLIRPARLAHAWDPVKQELWWDSKGSCLMRLGTTRSNNFEFEVTFEHTMLAGLRGLFLGMSPPLPEAANFAECQAFVIGFEPLEKQSALMFRASPQFNLPARRLEDMNREGREIPLTSKVFTQFVLSVRVKEGRLAWVRVDHLPVEGLAIHPPPKDEFLGDFGIYADADAGRILNARFKIYDPEH